MTRFSVLALFGVAGLVACGGASTPPAAPPFAPTPVSAPEPMAEPEPEAALDPEPAPSRDATEPEAEAPPKVDLVKTTAAGRPMVQYVDSQALTTTLGQNGGILKLSEATLRIPDGALREGLNVTFALAPKVKGPAEAIGAVYKVSPDVRSAGPKFQIALPVPAGAGPIGFALELQKFDEKTRKAKTAWEVVAPTKIFTDIDPPVALLELDALFDGHVTLTRASAEKAASQQP